MSMLETQKKFVTELAGAIPAGWQEVRVHFEYATVEGEQYEKFVAKRFDDGNESQFQFQLPLDALDVLIELNGDIPAGQSEKWTSVDVAIEASGKFRFDFGYGVPPLVAQSLQKV